MIIVCDTCEKDLYDCTCAEDLVDKLGLDRCLEIEQNYNEETPDVHPFCYNCGGDLDHWDQACDCDKNFLLD